jgi:hypothetical protein
MSILTLNHNQVIAAVQAIGAHRTVLIEGEHGVGKSAIYTQLKALPSFSKFLCLERPIDCTQLSDGSIWMPQVDKEKGVSRELPNERFGLHAGNRKGINGSLPVFMMLDEIAKVPQYVKNMLAPLVYEHRIGDFIAPEGSIIIAATNLSNEGLGDTLPAHIRDRLLLIRLRKPSQPEWCNWAIDTGLHPNSIAFVKINPKIMDSFLDYEEGGAFAGKDLARDNPYIFNPRAMQLSSASPRSLHAVSDIFYNAAGLDDTTLEALIVGAVGEPTGKDIMAMLAFQSEVTDWDDVMARPDTARIPKSDIGQIMQAYMFISRTKERDEAEKVLKFVSRMGGEPQSVFIHAMARSTRIATFATVKGMAEMLKEHRIYL